jgi:hypothetical protein
MVWDFQAEYKKYGHMDAAKFRELVSSSVTYLEPASPLPSYLDLVAEDILPQFWAQSAIQKIPARTSVGLKAGWLDPEQDGIDANDDGGHAANSEEAREEVETVRDDSAQDNVGRNTGSDDDAGDLEEGKKTAGSAGVRSDAPMDETSSRSDDEHGIVNL